MSALFLKVAWLDDNPNMIIKSTPMMEHAFGKLNSMPHFEPYQNPNILIDSLTKNKEQFDSVFLDINLGRPDIDGTDVYQRIRKINKEVAITFVSGHLNDRIWEEKIHKLQSIDEYLYTIAVPFPATQEKDFDELVTTSIEHIVKKNYTPQDRPKSTDHIPAQILEVEEKHVLLNCLLDPEARQFQIRRFDLEPIEDAVSLKKNQLIIVEIKTYIGKRIFSFKDNKDPKWEPYFERKMYFDGTEDYSAFLNPKASKNEDNL